MGRLVVRNISNTKMPTKKQQHWHWLKYDVKGVISFFFNGFFKFVKISNICGGTKVLELNRYISAVSEPILIKQR